MLVGTVDVFRSDGFICIFPLSPFSPLFHRFPSICRQSPCLPHFLFRAHLFLLFHSFSFFIISILFVFISSFQLFISLLFHFHLITFFLSLVYLILNFLFLFPITLYFILLSPPSSFFLSSSNLTDYFFCMFYSVKRQ